ncbi:beta-propeller domain-containing protein [Saliphagus sp. GCM10025308]
MGFDRQVLAVALVALLVGSSVGFAFAGELGGTRPAAADTNEPENRQLSNDTPQPTIEQFDSEAAFADYLRASNEGSGSFGFGMGRPVETAEEEATDDAADGDGASGNGGNGNGNDAARSGDSSGADERRYAETNVQEVMLDEPDILKTDGQTVYYGDRRFHGGSATHVIDASTPNDPTALSEIPRSGEMLLTDDDVLVQFDRNRLRGYDVSSPEDPEEAWSADFEGHLETARLYDGDVYLVVADRVSPAEPCPVEPLGDDGPAVDCTDVHYPSDQNGADTVYTTLRLDPSSGEVTDSVSFLGSSYTTATYVSENGVYLTYVDSPSHADVRLEFLLTTGEAYLDDRTLERLERLQGYDLSERATMTEIEAILADWRAGLDDDERRTKERELRDAWEEYVEENKRAFDRTGIVKVGFGGDLSVDAGGAVPGTPLNQWSMDEHDGHLRIATTINAPGAEWENDLYVLDSNLEVTGSVTGMGVDERVYSVRYEGDKAYVVTFRQIDPFHVIDVSDHENPVLEGELKLPGYSDYLHPLGEERILGIGQEDGKVKAVIFDASDPENPVIEDDEILEDRWSAVSESHNAFLLDERHGVFFLPGSEGGHVYAYEDGLERVTTVDTDGPAFRATYIGDSLYVFGEDELVVVDQTTWEEVKRLDL